MTDIWTSLKTEARPILLYGTGNGADKILDELTRLGISVSGVFASDGFVRRRDYRGFEVMSLASAEEKFGDFVALFAFGSARAEVLENAKRIMKRHTLLCPEVPVAGGEIFNLGYARRHKAEIEEAYSLLADEQSRLVFRETLLFKLDGRPDRLFLAETDGDEAIKDILRLTKEDSMLDLGGYNGDTVLSFSEKVGGFSHITAVEPDPKSFRRLKANTEHLGVRLLNCAVSDTDGSLDFSFGASRGSHSGGTDTVPCQRVDTVAENTHFSFIKMDVEGAELKALIGAEQTIKRDRPKMLVSAYHKSDDYFALPIKIHSLCPDYKIYMRHHPALPAWETNFYVV